MLIMDSGKLDELFTKKSVQLVRYLEEIVLYSSLDLV
jgi:hypothetical protein